MIDNLTGVDRKSVTCTKSTIVPKVIVMSFKNLLERLERFMLLQVSFIFKFHITLVYKIDSMCTNVCKFTNPSCINTIQLTLKLSLCYERLNSVRQEMYFLF